MNEKRRQTKREFLCRDHLWHLFSFVADDLGCTVDYLVNESMREYAKSRGYSITEALRTSELNPPLSSDQGAIAGSRDEFFEPQPTIIHAPEPVVYPKRLFVRVEDSEYEVTKDSFIIGRGSRSSDLTIPDANISRQHCVVERKGGQYYISDLGSTNGIEVNGLRVESYLIEQNLTVYVCDFALQFFFRD